MYLYMLCMNTYLEYTCVYVSVSLSLLCRMAPEVILAMDEGVYDGKVGGACSLGNHSTDHAYLHVQPVSLICFLTHILSG